MRSSPRIPTLIASLTMVGLLGVRALSAQVGVPPAAPTPAEIAFNRLLTAAEESDYRLTQVRRVRGYFQGMGRGGEWVGAVESLVHRGRRAGTLEAFSLDLLGLENVALTPLQLAHKQSVFRGQAAFLHRYQAFRVFDAAMASRNYALSIVGQTLRLGRPCLRLTVVARGLDRPSWLLDVDAATHYPLYSAEFSPAGVMVSELEVVRADYGAAARIPTGDDWAWRPRVGVVETTSVAAALAQMRTATVLEPVATSVGPGYQFELARVLTDPLTGQATLSLVYTDGVDCVFVNQTMRPLLADDGHVAKVFSDAGVTQCSFQYKTTEFLIVGRHSQVRDAVARVYAQAVATF